MRDPPEPHKTARGCGLEPRDPSGGAEAGWRRRAESRARSVGGNWILAEGTLRNARGGSAPLENYCKSGPKLAATHRSYPLRQPKGPRMHVQGVGHRRGGSSYSTGSSCTSTAPVASYHSRTRHGRQHTWQSSTYSCARPPPGSSVMVIVSPQCGQVTSASVSRAAASSASPSSRESASSSRTGS